MQNNSLIEKPPNVINNVVDDVIKLGITNEKEVSQTLTLIDKISNMNTFVTGDTNTKIKDDVIKVALQMSKLKSNQETHKENSKAIISITEKLDIIDNDINDEIANIFLDKILPGSIQTAVTGSKIEISVVKSLTENLENVHLKTKMGRIRLPAANAIGLPPGTNIGIKVY